MCGNGLINGTVLIRKYFIEEENKLDKLMLEWWRCINTYSSRDQLTFNFFASKKEFNGIHNYYLSSNGNLLYSNYFKRIRVATFNSQVNPNAKINIRQKIWFLILLVRRFIKKNLSGR